MIFVHSVILRINWQLRRFINSSVNNVVNTTVDSIPKFLLKGSYLGS